MADEPKEPKPPQVPTGDKPASATPPLSTPPAKPENASAPAAPPKAAAPAPPKPPVVLQTPLANEFVTRFRAKFGAALLDAMEDRKQAILTVERARLVEIALHLRDEEKFDMLADLTAVDWPKREKRFDVVLDLYSFPKNDIDALFMFRPIHRRQVGEHVEFFFVAQVERYFHQPGAFDGQNGLLPVLHCVQKCSTELGTKSRNEFVGEWSLQHHRRFWRGGSRRFWRRSGRTRVLGLSRGS